jgi:hypothetical protein
MRFNYLGFFLVSIVVGLLSVFLYFGYNLTCLNIEKNSRAPNNWQTYSAEGVFEISVPPSIELRNKSDEYSIQLQKYNLLKDDVSIFQQKGLSSRNKDALNHYCRVLIQYFEGAPGDYMTKNEALLIDDEFASVLQEMVTNEIGPMSSQIGQTEYRWKKSNNHTYLEVEYTRTGVNITPLVVCKICLFQNDDEMVKILMSYKENESELWQKDFALIPKYFRWL